MRPDRYFRYIMGRRRYRRNVNGGGKLTGYRRKAALIAASLVILAVVVALIPTSSFSQAQNYRGTSVSGAPDDEALLQMEVSETVAVGDQDPLVEVTNPLLDANLEVTLSLDNGLDGSLSVSGDSRPWDDSEVVFVLPPGDTETVLITVDNLFAPDTVTFDVEGTTGQLSVSAPNREASVEGGGTGPCNGNNPPWWCVFFD